MASVPARHAYVEHLTSLRDDGAVVRLPDPVPLGSSGRWWPPVMLDEAWIHAHAAEFDMFHLHFGFDAIGPDALQGIVRALRQHGIPLVHTVHDLRNPHHDDPAAHLAHLDVLVPAADVLITLTRGTADEVERRWGRRPVVLPHPHVVPLDRFPTTPRAPRAEYVVGVHAKSLRAGTDPAPVISALLPLIEELPRLRLVVDVHHEVADADAPRHDRALMALLRDAERHGTLELRVHDYFTDVELYDYLEGLDLSVLPYRFGTHSGWLEACHDLGTAVLAPDCGFFAEQRPCLSYRHDGSGPDAASLRAAVRAGYRERPLWAATRGAREAERDMLARAHHVLYAEALADARPRASA